MLSPWIQKQDAPITWRESEPSDWNSSLILKFYCWISASSVRALEWLFLWLFVTNPWKSYFLKGKEEEILNEPFPNAISFKKTVWIDNIVTKWLPANILNHRDEKDSDEHDAGGHHSDGVEDTGNKIDQSLHQCGVMLMLNLECWILSYTQWQTTCYS